MNSLMVPLRRYLFFNRRTAIPLEMVRWQYIGDIKATSLIPDKSYQQVCEAGECIGVKVQMDLLID